jgi:hypothetical protein
MEAAVLADTTRSLTAIADVPADDLDSYPGAVRAAACFGDNLDPPTPVK